MRRLLLLAALSLVVVAVVSGAARPARSGQVRWVITDLCGGLDSSAWDINERGQIVGSCDTTTGSRAFLWQKGKKTDLGALPGGTGSTAFAINERGQVAGASGTATGKTHAFLWQDGKMRDLGALRARQSLASDVNDRGQVVGVRSTVIVGFTHINAFEWQAGKAIDLGYLGWNPGYGYSTSPPPVALNDRGQIIFTRRPTSAAEQIHAFVRESGKTVELGTLGGNSTEAAAINELGQVAGKSVTATGKTHAFRWQKGRMTDLGEGAARAINNRGQVVGERDNHGRGRAFLWQMGKMTNLDDLGGSYAVAAAINDHGEIVGHAGAPNGHSHALLWTLRHGT